MYSDSWTRSLGSTIGVRDLVARLPLRVRGISELIGLGSDGKIGLDERLFSL